MITIVSQTEPVKQTVYEYSPPSMIEFYTLIIPPKSGQYTFVCV